MSHDDAKLHERAGALFVTLRRLPAEQRAAALREACGDDEALRREVLSLLAGDALPGLDAEQLGLRVRDEARRLVQAPSAERPMPERIGGCRIVRRLGDGGMGAVYEAVVETGTPLLPEGTPVAVKVLHPHLMEAPSSLERLRREGAIGKSLRHPNVVRTLECSSTTEGGRRTDFLVMELVRGQTLHALQQELGTVPEELCRHVAREAAAGLAAIHAAGIVHRDLKPENLFITTDGAVKIMDLGIARATAEAARLTQSGAFVGSLQYAPPEQLGAGSRLDGRADLYSLGVVLYELSTGINPFRSEDWHGVIQRVLNETPRRLGAVNPQVTPFFEELVHVLLEKNRERRLASAEELGEILELGEESLWWMSRAQAIRETTRRPLRRVRIPRETALIGRATEMAALRAAFRKARDGEGQVVLVEGEAGIGKTRLVDELVAQLHAEGEDFDFLHGSYPPGGTVSASGAFTEAYREHFGEQGLDEALAERLASAPELVPAFAALLADQRLPEGATPLNSGSLRSCFVQVTQAIASERVVVVLIDDLHFAPEDGRALFAALAQGVAGHRILLVGTGRPSLDQGWAAMIAEQPAVTRLSVSRLNVADLTELLRDAVKSLPLAETLAARLATLTGGNPFFVFEVLRSLREGRYLAQRADGTWATTAEIHDISIPTSIADVIEARLAQASAQERLLLGIAACVGFEFDPSLVGEVAGMERIPLLKALGTIERRHRLIRAAGRRYVFDHHQVQEHLYAGLGASERQEHHARIAEAIERATGAASKEIKAVEGATCVALVEHFVRGGLGPRALRYFERGRGYLGARTRTADEVALSDLVLAVPGLLAGAQRGEALLYVGQALNMLGRRQRQEATAREADALLEAAGATQLRPIAVYQLAMALQHATRLEEAQASFRRAIDLGREAGFRRAEAAGEHCLGSILSTQGRWADARVHAERALAIYRELGERYGEAAAMSNMGVVEMGLGHLTDSLVSCERALALSSEAGTRVFEAVIVGNLGANLRRLGRLDEALRLTERAIAIARETGDRESEGRSTCNLGAMLTDLGRDEEARERLLHGWSVLVATKGLLGHGWSLAALVAVELRAGRPESARALLEERLADLRELEDPRDASFALVLATRLPGADVAAAERAFAEHAWRLDALSRMEGWLRLFEATGEIRHLLEAKRVLDEAHALLSAQDRAARLQNVRECRELAAALAAAGLG